MTTENQQMLNQLGILSDAIFGEISKIEAARIAALADVSDAIRAEMYFDALLDPTLTTNIGNREFATLDALLHAAPAGSLINARVAAGKTIAMEASASVNRSAVTFTVDGTGAAPVIRPTVIEFQGENRLRIISTQGDSHFYFFGVDIEMPAKANNALPWRGDHNSLIRALHGGSGVGVGFRDCTLKGSDAGTAVVNPMQGGIVTMGMRDVDIDTIAAVGATGAAGDGVSIISKFNVALLNGGVVYSGGTSLSANIVGN